MVLAERGNKVLRVAKEEADKYLALGYSIKDVNGNVLKRALSDDISSLKATIKSLEEENANLKKEIETLKAQPKAQSTPATKKKSTKASVEE